MVDLKSYFHNKYQGGESFVENVILPIFGDDKYEDAYEEEVLENNPELIKMATSVGISQILRLGTINIPMNPTDVFDITVSNQVQMERNRVSIQLLIRRIMSTYSSAFMVFHYEDDTRWDWRFTFCSKQGSNQDSTDSKRYTFLLGPNQSCRTAAENFRKLAEKQGEIELDDIVKAFDVESLSKEFFEKYKAQYEKFCTYIYNNRCDETKFGSFFASCEDKIIRDYVKKLLGRLVFLQFLQKKGWLGGKSSQWNDGDPDFLQHLYEYATPTQKANFLDEVLEPLFQNALDANRPATNQDFDTGVEGFRCCKIPYLNGGLYGKDAAIDDAKSIFPAEYFHDLLTFFYQYNFTIDENDPNDAQVGIDPEMLGRIFENLLEDNKDKGAFYTPKSIVQYMCKESLIAYLQNSCSTDRARNAARTFVETHDAAPLREVHMEQNGKKTEGSLLESFDTMLKNVKICDPAIGSGAFPMGLLRELYACRSAIEDFDKITPAEIKKEIIQNNIYGVDIEKGAVDIARLRFWLTLILDEEDPKALPNLDFKIMQGNSLLESFHGVDLSNIAVGKQKVTKGLKSQAKDLQQNLFFFDEAQAQIDIRNSIRRYFATDNHSVKQLLLAKIENSVRLYLSHLTEGRPDLQSEIEGLPLCNDQFFLWHTFFADVFEKGGFDIVIGNPPYIRQEKLGMDYKKLLTSVYPKVGNGTADILVYFFGLSLNLLCNKGVLAFITSNKFLKTKYGQGLRNTLANETNVRLFIDFFELPVFQNASTDAGITILTKEPPISETKYYPVKTLDNLDLFDLTSKTHLLTIKDETEWKFIDTAESSILEKIYKDTISLREFTGNRLFYGVKTGMNKAFILSEQSIIDRLLSSESKNLIKKYVQPTDIHMWQVDTVDNYIIGTYPAMKIDIELYPTLKEYLLTFGIEKLEQTGKSYLINGEVVKARKKTNNKWFEVQDTIAYWKEFDKPKIIYIHTAKNHEFFLDTEGYHINNSCFMIGSDSRFLFCFLNSKLFSWFKRKKFVAYGDGDSDGRCKLDSNKMITIPIKKDVDETPFATIVNRVKFEIANNPNYDSSADKDEIDRLIYDLYGLKKNEIKIVEGNN